MACELCKTGECPFLEDVDRIAAMEGCEKSQKALAIDLSRGIRQVCSHPERAEQMIRILTPLANSAKII